MTTNWARYGGTIEDFLETGMDMAGIHDPTKKSEVKQQYSEQLKKQMQPNYSGTEVYRVITPKTDIGIGVEVASRECVYLHLVNPKTGVGTRL